MEYITVQAPFFRPRLRAATGDTFLCACKRSADVFLWHRKLQCPQEDWKKRNGRPMSIFIQMAIVAANSL